MEEGTAHSATTAIGSLVVAAQALQQMFERSFPLEGPLREGIAAVVAAVLFDLTLLPASATGGTAITVDRRPVDIRTPSNTERLVLVDAPRHLLVLAIRSAQIDVVYNGPGATAWQHAGKPRSRRGLRTISVKKLRTLDKAVNQRDRLPRARAWESLDEKYAGSARNLLSEHRRGTSSTTTVSSPISRTQFAKESGEEREARIQRNTGLGAEVSPEPDPDGTKIHSVPTRSGR